MELIFEAARSYEVFESNLFAGKYHFALPNPYHTVMSLEHGYSIFGKMTNDEDFRGIIVTRKDRGVHEPSDLKNKTMAFPAASALAATMMPQLFLSQHGLNVLTEIDARYVGTHESVLMNVYMEHCVAGGTWPPPWRKLQQERPDIADKLEIKWQTDKLPSNGLVTRNVTPKELVKRVAELLFSLNDSPHGKELLAKALAPGFEAATQETYAPVVEFINEYKTRVQGEKR